MCIGRLNVLPFSYPGRIEGSNSMAKYFLPHH
jgi:hypothetical protein